MSKNIKRFRWRGIKPSNGRVMKIDRLYKIQSDGNYKQVPFDNPD